MTFEQCHTVLVDIRRKQGTRCPLVKVQYAGTVVSGRVARSDSDPETRRETASPFGLLVLEGPGLQSGPQTILQIASIPEDGLHSIDD